MKKKTLLLVTLVCIATMTPVTAMATLISFGTTFEFSGGTPPAGATPWLTATFDDGGTAGSVTLTLTATNLTGSEFVTDWDFNIDPALEASIGSLLFGGPTKVGSFTDPTISKGVNAYQADGDGKYDIRFAFDPSGGVSSRFGVGDSATYTITGIPSLTANSFNFLSQPAGGHGPYYTAAHVQGIALGTSTGSGWVTTPEPSSFALFCAGFLGVLIWTGRRKTRTC